LNPLVSIIIPAFNAERWLRQCIESAIAQTWPKKEIIIVDDGSKDGTLNIAKSFSGKKVFVIAQDNMGASTARNHALSRAQGDYIQWLDADDLLAPDKIEIQVKHAVQIGNPSVLLSSAWGSFNTHIDTATFKANELWEDLEPAEWLYRKINLNLWMAIESWLVSRSLTLTAGPWNENLTLDDDGEYFCRILSQSSMVKFVKDARSFVRRGYRGLSSIWKIDNEKLESQFFSLKSHIQKLLFINDSRRNRDACLKLLTRWSILFYPERIDLFEDLCTTARSLGGDLSTPQLNRKYSWIQHIFGYRIAKKAQYCLPIVKTFGNNLRRDRSF